MRFFQQRHRSAFWSQLLLGLVAIFALPAHSSTFTDVEQRYVTEQKILTLSELSAIKKAEQIAQYSEQQSPSPFSLLQAVVIDDFFAKPQEADLLIISPIRAGPFNIRF